MKKFLTCLIVTLLLVSIMVLPVQAAYVSLAPDRFVNPSQNYLNVYGTTGSNLRGRSLNLWNKPTPGTDQRFDMIFITFNGSSNMYYVMYQGTSRYGINRSNTVVSGGRQAHMWIMNSSTKEGYTDCAFIPYSPNPADLTNMRYYRGEAMQYRGDYSGSQVFIGPGKGNWIA